MQECVIAVQAELKKRGHEAYIITPQSREAKNNPPADTFLVGSGTDIRSPFATTAQISASFNSDELQEIVDTHQFDILHFHEPWVPMLSRQLLSKSQSINIATFHARMPDGAMTKTIERVITPYTKSILKSFDAFTAVSDPAAQYVRSLTDAAIEIIPNGVNLTTYRSKRAKTSDSKRSILFVGRLERRKGIKYLIDAFRVLQDADCQLLIAGNGPERKKLEAMAEDMENVRFLGYVSEKEKLQLLREATVFCSPAVYGESFGIVLLEAMACGTPIVAANNPGYVSVMQGRGLISLVDPKDAQQFARRLALLLYDEELASLWRSWAKAYVRQFAYPKIVDQYEDLYKRLVKQ